MKPQIKRWWDSLYLAAKEALCQTHQIVLDDIEEADIVKIYNLIACSQMI